MSAQPGHSWTCLGACRGIHSQTGPIPLNISSLPQTVRLAIEAAQNKKASGITVIDLREVGAFTSYFVICTGFSTPQVQAICSEIEEQLHKHAQRSTEHREGRGSAGWAVLDFGGWGAHRWRAPDGRSGKAIPISANVGGTPPPGEAVSKSRGSGCRGSPPIRRR